ncbi:T9SS type B sorting domain-containing protein [Epilithonimonas sp.]|uniref:T9SS type B sorting domain-containing protein n=1 Tax=Epilithonimonas sp. TaxID=2894511 RepID=UPI0028A7EE21|nr:T9SS type B sorting domain-containing protein [Epilithonimonas sp.]
MIILKKIILLAIFVQFAISFSQSKYKFEVCDVNNNGTYEFQEPDYSLFKEMVSADLFGAAEVYISCPGQGIIKVKNLSSSPTIQKVCAPNDSIKSVFEIAINSQKEIFVTGEKNMIAVYKVDENKCTYTEIPTNLNSYIQSLSFDDLDNLYASDGGSNVYRGEKNNPYNFSVWHNFINGSPSGDYVKVNGKMYISWTFDIWRPDNVLFEVEVDNDNNFLSYKNLGAIKNNTYGLASEYGKLYGVTPNELYEINPADMSTKTIIKNPDTRPFYGEWWGAAGKHEAFKINYNVYRSEEDANNQKNPISFPYTNETKYLQTIYIRVDNLQNNSLIGIFPFDLIINKNPAINVEKEYTLCYNGDYTPVTLQTGLNDSNYSFQWLLNGTLLPAETSASLTTIQKGEYEVIAKNKISNCQSSEKTTVKQSDIFINNIDLQQSYINVFASGSDLPFFYNLNQSDWQDSHYFYDFPFGDLKFYVKNSKDCISKEFTKNFVPFNLITPNDDGKNDYFTFNYPIVKNNYEITIFTKNGSIILKAKLDSNFRWNGKNKLGNTFPSDTYWYAITENGKLIYSNYIVLKNY